MKSVRATLHAVELQASHSAESAERQRKADLYLEFLEAFMLCNAEPDRNSAEYREAERRLTSCNIRLLLYGNSSVIKAWGEIHKRQNDPVTDEHFAILTSLVSAMRKEVVRLDPDLNEEDAKNVLKKLA